MRSKPGESLVILWQGSWSHLRKVAGGFPSGRQPVIEEGCSSCYLFQDSISDLAWHSMLKTQARRSRRNPTLAH